MECCRASWSPGVAGLDLSNSAIDETEPTASPCCGLGSLASRMIPWCQTKRLWSMWYSVEMSSSALSRRTFSASRLRVKRWVRYCVVAPAAIAVRPPTRIGTVGDHSIPCLPALGVGAVGIRDNAPDRASCLPYPSNHSLPPDVLEGSECRGGVAAPGRP